MAFIEGKFEPTEWDKNFNDDYITDTVDLFNDGNMCEKIEPDRYILKSRREQLGMTQQQVADAAHIQLHQYQRLENIERGMAKASMRIGLSVCYALKLDPRRFVPEY